MRDIKFRGKSKENGEWVYGYYLKSGTDFHGGDNRHYIATNGTCNDYAGLKFIEVDPISIGQYTGIKDRDGQEIYEGDIWGTSCPDGKDPDGSECDKWNFEDWETKIVYWNDRGHYFVGLPDYDEYSSVFHPRFIKILGNVYENSDFYKVAK